MLFTCSKHSDLISKRIEDSKRIEHSDDSDDDLNEDLGGFIVSSDEEDGMDEVDEEGAKEIKDKERKRKERDARERRLNEDNVIKATNALIRGLNSPECLMI